MILELDGRRQSIGAPLGAGGGRFGDEVEHADRLIAEAGRRHRERVERLARRRLVDDRTKAPELPVPALGKQHRVAVAALVAGRGLIAQKLGRGQAQLDGALAVAERAGAIVEQRAHAAVEDQHRLDRLPAGEPRAHVRDRPFLDGEELDARLAERRRRGLKRDAAELAARVVEHRDHAVALEPHALRAPVTVEIAARLGERRRWRGGLGRRRGDGNHEREGERATGPHRRFL